MNATPRTPTNTPAPWIVTICRDGVPERLLQALAEAEQGRLAEAAGTMQGDVLAQVQALPSGSDAAVASHLVLGRTRQLLGHLREAAHSYEEVRRQRGDAAVTGELARLYRSVGRYSQALDCYRELLKTQSDSSLRLGQAVCLIQTGRYSEGMAQLRRLIETGNANAEIHLSYLFYRFYDSALDQRDHLAGYQEWARCYAPVRLPVPSYPNKPDPHRCLRIGYLSADFHTHAVATTFEPFLDGRSPAKFAFYGYGCVTQPDDTTTRLAGKFDRYRALAGRNVAEIVSCIRADRIDILVTLAAHCHVTIMQVLAARPAPVQVDLGSLGSTGLPQVDYRLTDALQDPPETQACYSETLVTLPGGTIPFASPTVDVAVGSLPALSQGTVTFGSFANGLKITDPVIATWAAVLHRVPQSRFLLKGPSGGDPVIHRRLLDRFQECGIAADRVHVVAWLPQVDHWRLYNEVDLALDTFPYNGGLTILEALWMGVPTVSVSGNTFVARTSRAILHHVGLDHLVADTPARMVDKAVALATRWEVLAKLRGNLRPALLASGLCDAARLARELEAAYRSMWQQWCEKQNAGGYAHG